MWASRLGWGVGSFQWFRMYIAVALGGDSISSEGERNLYRFHLKQGFEGVRVDGLVELRGQFCGIYTFKTCNSLNDLRSSQSHE